MGWRIVGGVGRVLMTAGTLILLFVVYQLWGTGLQEARSQGELRDEFEVLLGEADQAREADAAPQPEPPAEDPPAPNGSTPIDVVPPELQPRLPLPEIGDPVARIEIPKLGVTRTVVSGVSLTELARGPGHYPNSPLPGQAGNSAIAGHRTTYGQPFHNVDKLEPGDQILTQTVQGEFVYEVTGTEIVNPRDVWVLDDQLDDDGDPKAMLTLIACHPKYSLSQRIIVFADLVGSPAPELPGQAEARAAAGHDVESVDMIDAGLSGEPAARTPTILWGIACALIWLATWLVQMFLRRRLHREADEPTRAQRLLTWSPYLVGLPVFLVALYAFFENFGRLLPGNY